MSDFDNRFVALEKESTYGTTPGVAWTFGEVDDESIRHQYDLLTRDDMSRYGAAKSVTGKEYTEGDVNLAAMNDDFTALLMLGITGANTASGVSPVQHTFTESGTMPSFSMLVGREDKEHTYTGMVVNSLSVSASLNEYATISASFMGQSEDIASLAAVGSTTPSFPDSLPALYFSNAQVFFDGGSTASNAVKSISFDINLNRDGDNACGLGSTTYIRAPPVQRREISGTIEFNEVVHTDTVGEPTYTELTTEDGLEFNPGSGGAALKVVFGDDTTAELLSFTFYKIRFEAPEANVSGRDTNTMSVGFVALVDAGDTDKMMDINVFNSTAGTY